MIFDGLDELLDTSLRRDVVQAVEGFAHMYPTTSILVTSRRIGYEEAPLDNSLFPSIQLQQFNPGQVEKSTHNWFALMNRFLNASGGCSPPLSSRIACSSLILVLSPLMLSLMCGIYASERYIPRNRPEVYEKCAVLLFDRWDRQRGIHTPLPFDANIFNQLCGRSHLFMYNQPRKKASQSAP